MHTKQRGRFTLVEGFIILAIVGILLAVAFGPRVSEAGGFGNCNGREACADKSTNVEGGDATSHAIAINGGNNVNVRNKMSTDVELRNKNVNRNSNRQGQHQGQSQGQHQGQGQYQSAKAKQAQGQAQGMEYNGRTDVTVQGDTVTYKEAAQSAYSSAHHRYECLVGIGAGGSTTGLSLSFSGGYESELCNKGFVLRLLPDNHPRRAELLNSMVDDVIGPVVVEGEEPPRRVYEGDTNANLNADRN